MSSLNLTAASLQLFTTFCREAEDWNGQPLIELETKAQQGNLTDLVSKDLIDVVEEGKCSFAVFTAAGRQMALEIGYEIEEGF